MRDVTITRYGPGGADDCPGGVDCWHEHDEAPCQGENIVEVRTEQVED